MRSCIYVKLGLLRHAFGPEYLFHFVVKVEVKEKKWRPSIKMPYTGLSLKIRQEMRERELNDH